MVGNFSQLWLDKETQWNPSSVNCHHTQQHVRNAIQIKMSSLGRIYINRCITEQNRTEQKLIFFVMGRIVTHRRAFLFAVKMKKKRAMMWLTKTAHGMNKKFCKCNITVSWQKRRLIQMMTLLNIQTMCPPFLIILLSQKMHIYRKLLWFFRVNMICLSHAFG